MRKSVERAKQRRKERRQRRLDEGAGCLNAVWFVVELCELMVLLVGAALAGVVGLLGCTS